MYVYTVLMYVQYLCMQHMFPSINFSFILPYPFTPFFVSFVQKTKILLSQLKDTRINKNSSRIIMQLSVWVSNRHKFNNLL